MRNLLAGKCKNILVLAMAGSLFVSGTAFAKEPERTKVSMISVQQEASTEETTEAPVIQTGKDSDVLLSGVSVPGSQYGAPAPISFHVGFKEGTGFTLTSVYPVIDTTFPFESNDEAYKVCKIADCSYNFTVRSNVESGYHPVNFAIEYAGQDGKEYVVIKNLSIHLDAQPEPTTEEPTEAPTEEPEDDKISQPRLIVTGYETVPQKVMAGGDFKLTIHIKNTSNRTAISNIKLSISAAENEFLPASGSSTAFIQSIGCGTTTDIVIDMKAQASLEQKPYVLAIASEYEDNKCNPYQATENISIPVYQESRITINDFQVTPEIVEVGSQASVMFNINNMGRGVLNNVQVSIKSDTIECEKTFVGTIAAGTSGYADLMITGIAPSEEEGKATLVIEYEDVSGAVSTYEEEVVIPVVEAMEEPEIIGEEMVVDEQNTPAISPFIIIAVVIVLLVVVVVVIAVIVVAKKRKAKGEMDEDELS